MQSPSEESKEEEDQNISAGQDLQLKAVEGHYMQSPSEESKEEE